MKIFLDDIRSIPNGFEGARGYDDFVRIYSQNKGKVEEISLDHDLGELKTGYSVCLWLVENDAFEGLKKITIHTANPVGSKNMAQLLDRYAPKEVEIYILNLNKELERYYRQF